VFDRETLRGLDARLTGRALEAPESAFERRRRGSQLRAAPLIDKTLQELADGGGVLRCGFSPVVETLGGTVNYLQHTMGPDLCPDEGIAYCMPKNAAAAVASTLPPLTAVLLLAFLISSLSRQTGIAVGVGFGVLIAMGAAGALFDGARPFLVSARLTEPLASLRDLATGLANAELRFFAPQDRGKLLLGLGVSFGTLFSSWGLSAVVAWRRQILALAIALPGVLLLCVGQAQAEGELRFRTKQLRIDGEVQSIATADLDADGLGDLVVYATQGARSSSPRRFLCLFYQGEGGSFRSTPDQVVRVSGSAVARMLGDLDPRSPGLEIGYITPRGAVCLRAKDRVYAPRLQPLFFDDSLYDMASGKDLPSWATGLIDVDDNGRLDILFLRKGDAVLYLQDEEGRFESSARFPLAYEQKFGPRIESLLLRRFLSFRGNLARPVLVDCDGDGDHDLVCTNGNEVQTFLQKGGGVFGKDPDRRTRVHILSEDGGEEDALNQINSDLMDVTGNNQADLILFRNIGKVGIFESMRTQVIFYKATDEGWSSRATQIINLKGVSITPALIDLDDDGARDLVLSSLRTDLITNASRALFQSVTVTFLVFRYQKDRGRFSSAPDWSRDFTVDVDRVESGGTIPLAYFWGDFDGDGKNDLLSLEREDAFVIYPARVSPRVFGGTKLEFPDDEKHVVYLEPSDSFKITDLNGDGRDDLVLWYADADEGVQRGRVSLLLSD
jgi:hypothetical protein